MGYLVAFAVQFVICDYFFLVTACAVPMGFGVFMLMALLIDDLKFNLSSINKYVKSKRERSKLATYLTDTIHFHSVVKQLSFTTEVVAIVFSFQIS